MDAGIDGVMKGWVNRSLTSEIITTTSPNSLVNCLVLADGRSSTVKQAAQNVKALAYHQILQHVAEITPDPPGKRRTDRLKAAVRLCGLLHAPCPGGPDRDMGHPDWISSFMRRQYELHDRELAYEFERYIKGELGRSGMRGCLNFAYDECGRRYVGARGKGVDAQFTNTAEQLLRQIQVIATDEFVSLCEANDIRPDARAQVFKMFLAELDRSPEQSASRSR